MIRSAVVVALVAAMLVSAGTSDSFGQVREAPPAPATPTVQQIFRPPAGEIIGPPDWPLIVGPFGPMFNPLPSPSPISVTPTLSIREEYNDNVLLDNRHRRSDFITAFTPGVRAFVQGPGYRAFAGYDLTAEVYARNSELSNVGDRQNLALDGSYDWSSRLTLTLNEAFTRSYSTAQTSVLGVATGRVQSTTNTIAAGLSYLLTPRDTLRLVGYHSLTRVDEASQSAVNANSQSYGIDHTLDHLLTPRLTGTLGYQIRRFDFDAGDSSTVHTLRIGGGYRLTALWTVSASAGASIEAIDGHGTDVGPVATVSLTRLFPFGAASLAYNRSRGVAGTLGQTTDNQSIGATLVATSLWPGFSLTLAPRYATAESSTVNIKTFSADLIAAYHLTRDVSVFGSYTALYQRASGGVGAAAGDVDQNRVFLGVQVRYPIELN